MLLKFMFINEMFNDAIIQLDLLSISSSQSIQHRRLLHLRQSSKHLMTSSILIVII
jgi:hypothetical protein